MVGSFRFGVCMVVQNFDLIVDQSYRDQLSVMNDEMLPMQVWAWLVFGIDCIDISNNHRFLGLVLKYEVRHHRYCIVFMKFM